MGNGTAVAIREAPTALESPRSTRLLMPIASPADLLAAQEALRETVKAALKEDRDYGKIQGTERSTLLKPGAERVAVAFGCYYGPAEVVEREIDHDRVVSFTKWNKYKKQHESGESQGLYRYVVRVPVIERATGEVVGSGIGACSSMESKYISRPRDVENTVLKMAFKRAMVAACLSTFGLSDQFTQDAEDADGGDASGAPEPAPKKAAPAVEYADEDAKLYIRKLLATADLADDKKSTVIAELGAPMTRGRADKWIEKLRQVQPKKAAEPDPTPASLRDSAPTTSATTPSGDAATAGPSDALKKKKGEAKAAIEMAGIAMELNKLLNSAEAVELLTQEERMELVDDAVKATTPGDLKMLLGEVDAHLAQRRKMKAADDRGDADDDDDGDSAFEQMAARSPAR